MNIKNMLALTLLNLSCIGLQAADSGLDRPCGKYVSAIEENVKIVNSVKALMKRATTGEKVELTARVAGQLNKERGGYMVCASKRISPNRFKFESWMVKPSGIKELDPREKSRKDLSDLKNILIKSVKDYNDAVMHYEGAQDSAEVLDALNTVRQSATMFMVCLPESIIISRHGLVRINEYLRDAEQALAFGVEYISRGNKPMLIRSLTLPFMDKDVSLLPVTIFKRP